MAEVLPPMNGQSYVKNIKIAVFVVENISRFKQTILFLSVKVVEVALTIFNRYAEHVT